MNTWAPNFLRRAALTGDTLHRTAATVDNVADDRVHAHGDGSFHVVLLNQIRDPNRSA